MRGGKSFAAAGVVAALAASAFLLVRLDSVRAGNAWIKCREVKPGMTLAQATALMGASYREREAKDDRGRSQLVFPAPLFADTVPVLYVNPATKIVEDLACQ